MWKWRLKQKLTAAHSDLIWYFYDIWQPHKAALFQRIEGEDSECLELALKSYLHVHLIKMTGDTWHMSREGKKKQKKYKSQFYLNESDGLKKHILQLHDKTLTLYFPFSHQVWPGQMTSPPAWNDTQTPQISTVSRLFLTERAAKTILTSPWRERKLAQNGRRTLTVMPGSISLEQELELRPPTGEKYTCNQHKVAGFAVLLGWDSWLNVHQLLKHESYLCKCFSWRFSLEDAHTTARDDSFAGAAR